MIIFLFILLSDVEYDNPIREYQRISKGAFLLYEDNVTDNFVNRINEVENPEALYLIDSTLITGGLLNRSSYVEEKLQEKISGDYGYMDFRLSERYLKSGIRDIKNYRKQPGIRKIELSYLLNPSLQIAPLLLIKYNFPGWQSTLKNIKRYLLSYRYINNSLGIVINFLYLLIIFLIVIAIGIVFSNMVKSSSFIADWFRQRLNFNILWIPSIIFALFVWLPLVPFLVIMMGISLLRISRKSLVKLAVLCLFIPLLIAYTGEVNIRFSNDNPLFDCYLYRYDPRNFSSGGSEVPYCLVVRGIEMAKSERYEMAESLLEKGYNSKGSVIFRMNLSTVKLMEGEHEKAQNICEGILEEDPQNIVANFNLANIFLDRIDFDRASIYLDRISNSDWDISNKEPPIFKYPPDRWLLSNIMKIDGILSSIVDRKLFYFFIIFVFFIILSIVKSTENAYCPVCGSFIIRPVTISGEDICKRCAAKISLTKSKSIKERLKRQIKRKGGRISIIRNFLMNIVFPGSAHYYNGKFAPGMFIQLIGVIILAFTFGPFHSYSADNLKLNIFSGFNPILYIMVTYYIFVLIMTWRIAKNGNAG